MPASPRQPHFPHMTPAEAIERLRDFATLDHPTRNDELAGVLLQLLASMGEQDVVDAYVEARGDMDDYLNSAPRLLPALPRGCPALGSGPINGIPLRHEM